MWCLCNRTSIIPGYMHVRSSRRGYGMTCCTAGLYSSMQSVRVTAQECEVFMVSVAEWGLSDRT